jgi:transcription termination factor Rho
VIVISSVMATATRTATSNATTGISQERQPDRPQREVFNFDAFVETEGVLEVMPEGYGFLRSSDYNYLASPDDVYVNQQQIKQYGLKLGDTVHGYVRPPREGDKFFPLLKVDRINGRDPEWVRDRVPFKFLTPLVPGREVQPRGKGHEPQHARAGPLRPHRQRSAWLDRGAAKDG